MPTPTNVPTARPTPRVKVTENSGRRTRTAVSASQYPRPMPTACAISRRCRNDSSQPHSVLEGVGLPGQVRPHPVDNHCRALCTDAGRCGSPNGRRTTGAVRFTSTAAGSSAATARSWPASAAPAVVARAAINCECGAAAAASPYVLDRIDGGGERDGQDRLGYSACASPSTTWSKKSPSRDASRSKLSSNSASGSSTPDALPPARSPGSTAQA